MLTEKQKQELHKAIEKAKQPGACRYASEAVASPLCVVGQLAHMQGVSVETLRKWDKHIGVKVQGPGISELVEAAMPGTEKLEGFPVDLLERLQSKWDYGVTQIHGHDKEDSEKVLREMMHAAVDSYAAA